MKDREERTFVAKNSIDEIKEVMKTKLGFVKAMWCGDRACEDTIKEQTGATIRNMPLDQEVVSDKCICCGKKADKMVYIARAY